MTAPQPWTEAHRREALRYLLTEFARDADETVLPVEVTRLDVDTEEHFRRAVVRLVDLDGEERAVRRVRAIAGATPEARAMIEAARADCERIVGKLAEGRLVRETVRRIHVYDATGTCVDRFERGDAGAKERMTSAVMRGLRPVRVTVASVRKRVNG